MNNIDKVDLLFMIDNSSSMEDKQKNLREHVPQLVQTLVTGMRGPTCAVHLLGGKVDRRLFCNPRTNTCVRSCSGDTDCPAAWVCDKRADTLMATASAARPMGSPICVNPTCGTS
ncbi:MAG TPA: hypothetical protein VF331_23350 [Polyangiales bacterium]